MELIMLMPEWLRVTSALVLVAFFGIGVAMILQNTLGGPKQ